jgi:hypothetical protein
VGVEGCPLCGGGAHLHAELRGGRYLRCGGCALLFLERARHPDAGAERAHYDTHRNDPADAGYRAFLARLADPLAARLPAGAEGLDYGAGPAPTLHLMLAERGFRTRAWDPLYLPDRAALERTYDFVTCSEVVEHLHHPAREFARLDGLLRAGGWLGVMTEELRPETDLATWRYARDPTHVAFYSPETMGWIARWRGWRLHHPRANVFLFHKPTAPDPE